MGDPSGGSQYYAGGGNPACGPSLGRSLGGGGKASEPSCTNGLVNTGSGGGGNAPSTDGDGGSGIVIIRYKFQN